MSKRIFITGIGIISAIGKNIPDTFLSLSESRSGLGRIKWLDTVHKDEILVAEVPFSNEELASMAKVESLDGYTRTTLLAVIAASEAVNSAKITNMLELTTGLISGNTVGGMDKSEIYYYDYLKERKGNSYIETHDCADSTEKLADLFGISSFVTTVSTACSSAANAMMLGARMIQNGSLQRVIAGGTECLTKFHINGFNSLKILDPNPCKPFDQNRMGINLGEGAGYVILEGEEALLTPERIICELSGWGNACEAFHQTASSPDGNGAYLAMKKALDMSGLKPSDIAYINAHGTGTDNNDVSEGHAIEHLFGDTIPHVSSTKPFTGHTTSAAGVIESIISILGMKNNMIFPNLNFSEQIDELKFSPVKQLIPNINQKHVLSNSFGFGGNNTALIFSQFS